jgi:O-antigen ligase
LNYLANILRNIVASKLLKEWLITVLAIGLFSMLAYRWAFYPGSNLTPMIIAIIIAVLTLWRPIIGLCIYLVAYPLVPASGSVDIIKTGILALTVLLLFIWWYKNIRAGAKPWLRPEYRWLFILFLYLCFSPLLGLKYGFSIMDWARDIAPLLNLLMIPVLAERLNDPRYRWLLYLVFLPIAAGLMRDIMLLMTGYGFAELVPLLLFPIRMSTFHPGMVFGLGLVLFIQKAPRRWLWLVFSLMGAGVTFLTQTRTVWLSLAFMVGLLLVFFTHHRRKAVMLIVVILAFMGLLMFRGGGASSYGEQQSIRYQQFLGYQTDPSVKSRFDELYQAMVLFKSSPVFGVGFGYQYHFWRHWVSSLKGSGYFDTNFTHNDITNVAAKGGMVGVLLFGMLLYGFARQLNVRRDTIKEPVAQSLAVLGIIAIYQSLFVGLSTPVYQTREAIFLLAVIIAMGLGYKRDEVNEQ